MSTDIIPTKEIITFNEVNESMLEKLFHFLNINLLNETELEKHVTQIHQMCTGSIVREIGVACCKTWLQGSNNNLIQLKTEEKKVISYVFGYLIFCLKRKFQRIKKWSGCKEVTSAASKLIREKQG